MKKWLLLGFSLVFAVLMVEGFVRVLGLAPDYKFYPGPFVAHPVYDLALRPNYRGYQGPVPIQINGDGLRGSPYTDEKKGYRLVLLGDSFAFGWGLNYSETLASILESRLQQEKPGARVINTSAPGYATWHQLQFLKTHIADMQPDAVMLVLVDNDCNGREWIVNASGSLTERGMGRLATPTSQFLFNHPTFSRYSAFYRLIKQGVRNIIHNRHHYQTMRDLYGITDPLYRMDRTFGLSSLDIPPNLREEAAVWKEVFTQLDELKRLCRAKRIPFHVLNVTTSPTIAAELKHRDIHSAPLLIERPVIDSFPHDGHPNASGHRKMADVAWALLKTAGF